MDTSKQYQLLSNELLEEIEEMNKDEQENYLFLSKSTEFKGRWSVESLWPTFFFDFEEIIGHYRTVSPAGIQEFLETSKNLGYKIVFEEAPETIMEEYEHLSDPPPFELNSTLEGTTRGFYPWQVQGFNKLIRDEKLKAGMAIWDTGSGKTIFVASAILWHESYGHPFDLALLVVKKNNKTDAQYKLKKLAGIESFVIEKTVEKRMKIYEEIETRLLEGRKVVAITNYEKFKEDYEFFKMIMEKRDVLLFWDEMPTKLSHRTTKLYSKIKNCLWAKYETRAEGLAGAVPLPKWMRQWELTATPIEGSPEGLFNCVRLMDPALLGRAKEFEADYVSYHNQISRKPERWTRLDKLEGKIEFMVHRVSRQDPEVNKMFPVIMEDPLIIDWDPDIRKIYELLTNKAAKLIEEDSEFADNNILAIIQAMQMLCDAPSMIVQSAENRQEFEKVLVNLGEDDALPNINGPRGSEIALILLEALGKQPKDDHHTKLETLKEILTEKHPDAKVLIYMTWASYGFKPLEAKLNEWGITYVTYTGTEKQRQEAKDRFRSDSTVRVFLSSDKGSDSIDLPEAEVGINYNLPWTWTRKRQRQGRNNRVDSKLETTWWYDLIMADSIENRKREIIDTKHGYHSALFDGKAIEDSISSKLTREDLLYILLGG
jgi:SNF2 family DNA or RNA helicase